MVLGVLRVRLGADGHDLADLLPRFFELVSGEEWGDRPPLGEHRRQDGDAARAAAMEAALAADDRSAVVELIVEAVVDHDPGTAAVGEAGLAEGSELAALLRAGTGGGALAVLRHLGLAAPAKSGMPRQARRVLEFILREPGVDGRAIRHSLSLSTESQVSRLLRDLREAGLIQDVSRQGPSRRWQITAAGRAALRKE
jgi:DNA-binding transcriptional ArsR family regulator